MNDQKKTKAQLIEELVGLRQVSEREKQLREVIEGMPVGFALCEVILDKQGKPIDYRFLNINSIFEKLTGQKAEACIGKTVKEIYPDIEQSWIERYGSVVKSKKQTRFIEYNHNTEKYYFVNAYSPSENIFAMLFEDISESRKAKEALLKSENNYTQLFDSMTEIFQVIELVHNEKGKVVDYYYLQVNPAFEKMVNMKKKELVGKRAKEIFGSVKSRWIKIYERVEKTGRSENYKNFEEEFDKFYNIYAWKVNENQVAVIFTDNTEKIETEEALKESEESFSLAMRATKDGLYDWNLITNEIYYSPGWKNILGYEDDELPNDFSVWNKLAQPKDAQKFQEMLGELIDKRRDLFEIEIKMKHKDGHWVDILSRAEAVFDDGGKAIRIIGTHVDISERKRAEKEKQEMEVHLRQQQKLESIGTLASGIAHELNNPITGIMNYAQLIHDRIDPAESQLSEFSVGIIKESERMAKIVRDLLTFSRQDKQSHSPARITDIVNDTLSLIGSIFRRDQITLEVDIPDDLPRVMCRSQQIQQVLMNLLTNARDALNQRYPDYDPDKVIMVSAGLFEKGGQRWLRTTVEDHGAGIPAAIRERIFDPFYTTKDRTLGTGLGLSISLGIVEDHHGELSFESEKGQPTRFYLDLPVDAK